MRKEKGFTLIELLIVVAIIGIIAAIAIPNLLNAIDRGKQKRTMADMRSVGTAVESYAVDNNVYPTANTAAALRLQEHTTELQSLTNPVCWVMLFEITSETTQCTVSWHVKDNT